MAFMDMFKRKASSPVDLNNHLDSKQLPKQNTMDESEKASDKPLKVERISAQTQQPIISKPAIAQETIHTFAQVSRNIEQKQNRPQEIRWPKNGTNARWLANTAYFFVYADVGFLRSKGANAFVKEWRDEKQQKNLRRSWFIPQFELDKLNEDEHEKVLQWADTYAVRSMQKNYIELFSAVSGNNWNIVFLTEQGDHNSIIRKAAEESHVNVRLYSVSEEGLLLPIFISSPLRQTYETSKSRNAGGLKVNAFSTPMRMAAIHHNLNRPLDIPTSGCSLRDDTNTELRLCEAVSSNATSITYSTDRNGYFAKIYTMELLLSDLPEQKAKLMLSRKIEIEGVCWPISMLHDTRGAFVGILVPNYVGIPLRDGLLRESAARERFAGWNKRDMTTLALAILNLLSELHSWNVYFGLLNLATIYVKNKNDIYLIDMDEWQIEGYPVLSDNKLFVPPEMQKEKAQLHFYTMDEINYQIAYLMFMLMMPGRTPYVRSNGGTVTDSIINQDFAFGMGDGMRSTTRQESSSGFWKFVWDHISYDLGKDFYHTFARGGQYSTAGRRLNLNQWKRDMARFNENLDHPYDSESLKIYPSTFRRAENRVFQTCGFCRKEHPSFFFQKQLRIQVDHQWKNVALDSVLGSRIICKICYHESAEEFSPNDSKSYFICAGCGQKFYYTNAAMFTHEYMERFQGWKPKKWCSNCKEPYEERSCIQCGRKFVVTVGQLRAYGADKLPKRCPECQRTRIRY